MIAMLPQITSIKSVAAGSNIVVSGSGTPTVSVTAGPIFSTLTLTTGPLVVTNGSQTSTLAGNGLTVQGNINSSNGVFQSPATIIQFCPSSESSSCPFQVSPSVIQVGGSSFGATGATINGNIQTANGVVESASGFNLDLSAGGASSGYPYVASSTEVLFAADGSTTSQGTVGPVYTATNGNPPTGYHEVSDAFTCTTNTSGICSGTISFTGASAFAGQSYVCSGNLVGQAGILGTFSGPSFSATNGTTVAYYASGLAASQSYSAIYNCRGH
jgi:hypothetical protein